jgi:hypothetical protein
VTVDDEALTIFGGTVWVEGAMIEPFSTISLYDLAAMRLSEMFSCSFSWALSEESLPLSRTRILLILRDDLSLTSSFAEERGTSLPEPLTVLYGWMGETSLERDLENLGENSALRFGGSGT